MRISNFGCFGGGVIVVPKVFDCVAEFFALIYSRLLIVREYFFFLSLCFWNLERRFDSFGI